MGAESQVPQRVLMEYMTGPGASGLVHAACRAGGRAPHVSAAGFHYQVSELDVASWKVTSTHARPGAGVSVTFRVSLVRADDSLSITAVASTERVPRGASIPLRLDPGVISSRYRQLPPIPVQVWVFPRDPLLPQLATFYNADTVGEVLNLDDLRLKPVVYRPTRRAMLRVLHGDDTVAWIKVLFPAKAEQLQKTLDLLGPSEFPIAEAVPVSAPGVIIQRHGHGRPLSNLISKQPHHAARMFGQIKRVLDALPKTVLDLSPQPSWTDRRTHYARSLASSIPDLQPAIERLMSIIDTCLDDSAPVVPTHGDLFEANLLTDGSTITTVLDLDSIGPGKRADDYACLLAHASVLPFLSPRRWITAQPIEPWRHRLNQFLPGKRCPSYPESETALEAWRIHAEREVNPADLYARTAAVTLSLAASASLMWGEAETRARFARSLWWAELADENA